MIFPEASLHQPRGLLGSEKGRQKMNELNQAKDKLAEACRFNFTADHGGFDKTSPDGHLMVTRFLVSQGSGFMCFSGVYVEKSPEKLVFLGDELSPFQLSDMNTWCIYHPLWVTGCSEWDFCGICLAVCDFLFRHSSMFIELYNITICLNFWIAATQICLYIYMFSRFARVATMNLLFHWDDFAQTNCLRGDDPLGIFLCSHWKNLGLQTHGTGIVSVVWVTLVTSIAGITRLNLFDMVMGFQLLWTHTEKWASPWALPHLAIPFSRRFMKVLYLYNSTIRRPFFGPFHSHGGTPSHHTF